MANQTNTSLALVSGRVNTRKTLTMMAGGNTSLKLLKPIATKLSKTAVLFQGMEHDAMTDTYRWAPSAPVDIPGNSPSLYDPSTKLTPQQKWAARWTTEFMKLVHKQLNEWDSLIEEQLHEDIPLIGLMFDFGTHSSVHLIGDVSARGCDVVLLEPITLSKTNQGQVIQHDCNHGWMVPSSLSFEPLVQAIATIYDDVVASKKTGIAMNMVTMRLAPDHALDAGGTFRLVYIITTTSLVSTLRIRRPYRKRKDTHQHSVQRVSELAGDKGDTENGVEEDDVESEDATDDEDAEQIEHIEMELRGDIDDSMLDAFSQQMEADQHFQDLETLDSINSKLVATVVEKHHDDTLGLGTESDIHRVQDNAEPGSELEFDLERTFEDETGEELLQIFLHQRLSPETHASAAGPRVSGSVEPETDHQVNLTQQQIIDALQKWKCEVDKSLQSCATMAESLRRLDVDYYDATLSSDVSLVLHAKSADDSVDVSYITWVKPHKKLQGRIVSLDESDCIVYPSHFHAAKLTFTGSIMILPCVGARVRKSQREEVPADVRRLRQMFTTSVTTDLDESGVFANLVTDLEGALLCIACGSDRSAVARCALCLCGLHTKCGRDLSTHLNSFGHTHGVPTLNDPDRPLSLLELPFTFLSGS